METKQIFSCIDLFAGCGGLSLGLEQAGFTNILFSEINLNAAETYMANRIDQEIIPVGDVYSLTDANLAILKSYWKNCRGITDVDLICGGPPCQGFSGIGHRRTFQLEKRDIPSNHLFQEMIRIISAIRPKMFLFENVKGLLTSKWSADGQNGEIFRQVHSEFLQISGYTVRYELVHSKHYGVPQNRPRVLLVGLRQDAFWSAKQLSLFEKSQDESKYATAAERVALPKQDAIAYQFLPVASGTPPTMVELLSDLEDAAYLAKGETVAYPFEPQNAFQRELRTLPDGTLLGKGSPLSEQQYSNHKPKIRAKFAHMIANDGEIPEEMRTKKFAQRVLPKTWPDEGPNITACTLPEDYVHYAQPRGPTVREWARIQTFPDWYIFTGPRTTGGRRRAGDPSLGIWTRDVPRYTQIGNAVPVLLARKVGEHFLKLLKREIKPTL